MTITKYINNQFTFLDMAEPWQLGFQDPATPVMEGIINFHHDLMFFLIMITVFVCWMLFRVITLFNEKKNKIPSTVVHGATIEIIWTSIPALILLTVAIPSFALLYSMDEVIDPIITLKVIGSQWYWSYEYSDNLEFSDEPLIFDSYMIQEDDLAIGQFRILEVDNRVVVPTNSHIRVLITASDVLHSWAIPSLGIKLDACPGRLNQTSMFIKREGVFYGQCSEICGVNHGFMPIVVEAVSLEDYLTWLKNKINFDFNV
uniref:cytochrome c oxidase subunit 2 n=1 Tax=Phytophthora litchii TaxID=100870 RepID=UPI0020287C52|nr:cytochrome c oxidase subunit 2 [Phytophthora litchii]DAZ88115.1 TPA_asm: cytochrome c oxidase subunit 2 [Phytophthora litchii]